MGYAAPSPSEMFSDAESPTEVASRFEAYKSTLADSHKRAKDTGAMFVPGEGIVKTVGDREAIAARVEQITKSVSPEVLASIQGELDALKSVQGDINKDWTTTFPNSTGLVPYDLEAPAKLLVPRLTPLRNSTPRGKGVGTARQFKRILGWSNSGVGGVADQSPFMNSNSVQTNFGGLALRRGAKISYASDSKSVTYVEMGLSDQVNWQAQFAGQGFQDIRSLSQTALLWAHMGGEERAQLYGRGASGNGYKGSVAAPTVTATGSATGGSIGAGTYYVVVTAKTGFGESVVSAEVNTGALTGGSNSITVNVTSEPAGALNYNLYVGTAAGAETFQTNFVGNSFVLTSYATGGAAKPAADSSFDANGYDGWLTVLTDPAQSGYFKRQNAKLSTSNPGQEFQAAFLSLYQSVKADPDDIWLDAAVMVELGDLLKTSSSANYRITLDNNGQGRTLGTSVTGVLNEVTHKMVDVNVHPYMPLGCALIRSKTLPVPDSEVNNTTEIINVQDYMAVDWPVVQMTYDQSTYQYGTMVHYAPGWSGAIVGIQ